MATFRLSILMLSVSVAVAWPAVAHARGKQRVALAKGKKKKKPKNKKKRSKAQREADRHFKNGVRLFDERKYAEALAEFEQAYALAPHPLVLYNLAAAHRALSQYDKAVDFYNRFLAEASDQIEASAIERAREELDDLLRLVARVEVVTEPIGASVTVDGREIGTTPLSDSLVLGPGDHTIAAVLSGGAESTRKIRVAAGDTLRVELNVKARSPDTSGEQPDVAVPVTEAELRRFGVMASYGTNALEVAETGAPVLGVGFAFTDRLSLGVGVVVTALSAVPEIRYRLLGSTLSLHGVAAVPISFRDGDQSETFAAAAGGLGIKYQASQLLSLRLETWVSYAGSDHGTTVPTFAGAELWF